MRRKTTAWIAAGALGAGLTASFVWAQQASRSTDAVSTYGASASRAGRSLLRNGLDYLNYQQYDRALKFLRQAEGHSDELNASEKARLRQGIESAQKGLRAAADPDETPYALSERSRPRQGFAVASAPTALADRSAPGASMTPARPARPLDIDAPAFGGHSPLDDEGPGEPVQLARGTAPEPGAYDADPGRLDASSHPDANANAATDVHLQRARATESASATAKAPRQPREIPSMDAPPLSSFGDAPAAPVVEAPAAPVVEAPAAPVVDAPAAPVVEAPAAPVVEAPAASAAPAPIPLEVVPADAPANEIAGAPAQAAALSQSSAPVSEPAVPVVEPSSPPPASEPTTATATATEMAQPSPILEQPAPVPTPAPGHAEDTSNVVQTAGDGPAPTQAPETAPPTQIALAPVPEPAPAVENAPAPTPEPAPAVENAPAPTPEPASAVENAPAPTPEPASAAESAPAAAIETVSPVPPIENEAPAMPELPPLPPDLGRTAPSTPNAASPAPVTAAPTPNAADTAAPPAMPETPNAMDLPPLPSDLGRSSNDGPAAAKADTNAPAAPLGPAPGAIPNEEAVPSEPASNANANAAPPEANTNAEASAIELPPLPVGLNVPAPASEATPAPAPEATPAPAVAEDNAVPTPAPETAPVADVTAVPTPAPEATPAPEIARRPETDQGTGAETSASANVHDEPVVEEAPPALVSDTNAPAAGAPPTAAAAASAPLGPIDGTGSLVPPRAAHTSLLTADQQRHIEQIARAQENQDKVRREAMAQERARINGGGDALSRDTNPSNLQTQLDLSRAPSPAQARPIRAIPVPDDWVPLGPRRWSPQRKMWAAAATCHLPLYFQDPMLERYGHPVEQFFGPVGRFISYPVDDPRQSTQRNYIAQAAFSVGLFASQVAVWPYNIIMDPPWEAQYDLGYYRPGDMIPTDTYWLPLHGYGPPLRGDRY